MDQEPESFITELGEVNGIKMVAVLNDYLAYHAFTRDSGQLQTEPKEYTVFTLDRYVSSEFHGIMPDSGAARISSAGEQQVIALQREIPGITIDPSSVGTSTIKFRKGTTTVKGIVRVPTPLGTISFHVVPINTLFLMCLQDIDAIGV
jgi:hypothetical protein